MSTTLYQHILQNPVKYIGSIGTVNWRQWIYSTEGHMIRKEISYVPGLFKIFDEILMNAVQHKSRDSTMSKLWININRETSEISIRNDGKGIPYFEMDGRSMLSNIFGYNGEVCYPNLKQTIGGGKLVNMFCSSFRVKTITNKTLYDQTWSRNMMEEGRINIEPNWPTDDMTEVTFIPDLNKFEVDKLDDDTVAIMSRRAYDVSFDVCTHFIHQNRKP